MYVAINDSGDELHDNSDWIEIWSSSRLVDKSVGLSGSFFSSCGIYGRTFFRNQFEWKSFPFSYLMNLFKRFADDTYVGNTSTAEEKQTQRTHFLNLGNDESLPVLSLTPDT